jgi:hypothetical protein
VKGPQVLLPQFLRYSSSGTAAKPSCDVAATEVAAACTGCCGLEEQQLLPEGSQHPSQVDVQARYSNTPAFYRMPWIVLQSTAMAAAAHHASASQPTELYSCCF